MTETNLTEFRSLLRKAIGRRTQAQFAQESGISSSHLNRMLNAPSIPAPTKQTLYKISSTAQNGITFDMLKKTLEQADRKDMAADMNRFIMEKLSERKTEPSLEQKAKYAMSTMASVIAGYKNKEGIITKEHGCFPHLENFMEQLLSDIKDTDDETAEISYEIRHVYPYDKERHPEAGHFAEVHLSMPGEEKTATALLLLFFKKEPMYGTPEGIPYILDACTSIEEICDLYGLPYAKDMEKWARMEERMGGDMRELMYELPWYLEYKPNDTFQETWKNIEEDEHISYPQTIGGIGFYLDDIPENLTEFLYRHEDKLQEYRNTDNDPWRDAWGDLQLTLKQAWERLLNKEEETDRYLADTLDQTTMPGYGGTIAIILETATGFPFRFYKASEYSTPCILLSEIDMERNHIARETALYSTGKYALEMGIHKIGDILYTRTVQERKHGHTYIVCDEPEPYNILDHMAELEYTEEIPPEGRTYAARLKDGRYLPVIRLSGGRCIYRCRNFRYDIEAWSKDPLPEEKTINECWAWPDR